MSDALIPILVVAVVIGLLAASVWLDRKRRAHLQGAARDLGLAFDPAARSDLHRRYAHGLFDRGRSRRASNTLHGVAKLAGHACPVRMGDYRFTTGSGKHRKTHRYSYCLVDLPWVGTPNLVVRTEDLGDKLMGGLGFDDIDFESEEFSRSFWVTSTDRKYAYDVIHPRMMEFLMRTDGFDIEILNDVCLLTRGSGRWPPETFRHALAWAAPFVSGWPDHVTDRLAQRDARGGAA